MYPLRDYPSQTNKTLFNSGDIMTMHLDLDKKTLAFSKNDQYLGIAFENIANTAKYYAAVRFNHNKNSSITVVSYKQIQEEEKKDDVESQDDDVVNTNYIKEYTQYVTKQLNILQTEYSSDKIKHLDFKQLQNVSKYLNELDGDIKGLNIEIQKCCDESSKSKQILSQQRTPDTANYESWTLKQVEIWLYSLENGRFAKYVTNLIAGFRTDHVAAKDLPDLDNGDLKGFGVGLFPDRKSLKGHLNQLRQQNEGAPTAYI